MKFVIFQAGAWIYIKKMAIESLKNQLETAEKKLAFFKEKQISGGLSLDQEFKLE